YRHSMKMFFPSTYPSSRRPCLNGSMRAVLEEGEGPPATRYPMRATFPVCCASADAQSAKSMAHIAKLPSFRLFIFLPTPHISCLTAVLVLCLNLGRTYTFHCRRKSQAGFEIVGLSWSMFRSGPRWP